LYQIKISHQNYSCCTKILLCLFMLQKNSKYCNKFKLQYSWATCEFSGGIQIWTNCNLLAICREKIQKKAKNSDLLNKQYQIHCVLMYEILNLSQLLVYTVYEMQTCHSKFNMKFGAKFEFCNKFNFPANFVLPAKFYLDAKHKLEIKDM